MADLTGKDASDTIKITGASPSAGTESFYMDVDSNGNVKSVVNNASGASAVNIQDGGNSLTIDATSLPLPTGAATAANQATEIASLASIDAGIPSALGQTTMSASMPVVLASNQSSIPVIQSGTWSVSVADSTRQSYSAASSGFICAAAATDIFNLTGSASKTIRVTRIEISGTTTAGSGFSTSVTLVKRSTVDTAGTSVAATNVPYDSTNNAATATAKHYTANPTLGTGVGNIRADRMLIATLGAAQNYLVWDFGNRPTQAVVLRGVSEQLGINFGGVTITNPVISISIEWTEE